MWIPLFMSTLAGMGTLLGGVVLLALVHWLDGPRLKKGTRPPCLLLARLQASCAGVMTAIGLELLWMECIPHLGLSVSAICATIGGLILPLLSACLPHDEDHRLDHDLELSPLSNPTGGLYEKDGSISLDEPENQKQMLKSSIVIFTLHNFPEGIYVLLCIP